MKLEAFATLDALLRTGTMIAAAREMHVTPGAVSLQIKQIEAYLGRPLFDRSGLKVRPMPLAFEVAAAMRQGMDRLDALKRRPAVAVEGTVRLGVIDSMQPLLVPATLRMLRDRYPHLDVLPSRGKSAELLSAVKAGVLDAAVLAQPATGGTARISSYPLMRRELVLLVPPHETDTSLRSLFKRYEWIRFDRNTVTGRMASRYLNAHVKETHGSLEFDGVPVIVAAVSAGLGVSMVALQEPSICLLYPVRVLGLGRTAPAIHISLIARKTDADSRPMGVLRETMIEVLDNASTQPTVDKLMHPIDVARVSSR